MEEFTREIVQYTLQIDWVEAAGLFFGLACVILLIRENIWTWPAGIAYVLLSLVIFWQQRLYGDLLLHVFYLILNIYGWYYWIRGRRQRRELVPITVYSVKTNLLILIVSVVGIFIFGWFLEHLPDFIAQLPQASVPYWDSATSILSITGMWLTARKKLENWVYWFVVDMLATGIYFYKEIYFYAVLYLIYIGLAITGFIIWNKAKLKRRGAMK